MRAASGSKFIKSICLTAARLTNTILCKSLRKVVTTKPKVVTKLKEIAFHLNDNELWSSCFIYINIHVYLYI